MADVPASGIDENINKRWASWQGSDIQEIQCLGLPILGKADHLELVGHRQVVQHARQGTCGQD